MQTFYSELKVYKWIVGAVDNEDDIYYHEKQQPRWVGV